MAQLGGILGRLLGPSLKTGLPLMKNVLKPSAKSVLVPLVLTAATSATDSAIQKNCVRNASFGFSKIKR